MMMGEVPVRGGLLEEGTSEPATAEVSLSYAGIWGKAFYSS